MKTRMPGAHGPQPIPSPKLPPTGKTLGVAFIFFSPLARGMLGDMATARPNDGVRRANPRFTEPNFTDSTLKINAFRAFYATRGWSTPATALA